MNHTFKSKVLVDKVFKKIILTIGCGAFLVLNICLVNARAALWYTVSRTNMDILDVFCTVEICKMYMQPFLEINRSKCGVV